jgi:hypothetical protein
MGKGVFLWKGDGEGILSSGELDTYLLGGFPWYVVEAGMAHAVRLMLLLSAIVALGTGLLVGALVGVAEAWVVAAHHSVTFSPDGHTVNEYRPTASDGRPITAGWGAGLLAGGLTFLALLRRPVGPDTGRSNGGRRETGSSQPYQPTGPA